MNHNESLAARFPGVSQPTTDFASVRTKLRTLPLYYDIDLTNARTLGNGAAPALQLQLNGNFFYIDQKSNSGLATVHFQDDTLGLVTPITVQPGFMARIPFTQVIIENSSQPGMILRIIYGVDIDFQPAGGSVQVTGNVSVIDGGKSRTLAGQTFIGDISCSAVAAQFSHVQIKNPTGSGKRAVIRQVLFGSAVAGNPAIKQYDTDLTTLSGNAPAKLIGGSSAVCQLRTENNAAQLGTGRVLGSGFLQASTQPPPIVLGEPVILRPGRGVVVYHSVVNSNLSACFEFYEEDDL